MMPDPGCEALRRELLASVERNRSDAILLSGGLDSSILASMAAKFADLTAITIAYNDAPDLRYARMVAERYGARHWVRHLAVTDIERCAENVVRIMRSFDPMEVRNSVVLYASLDELRRQGFRSAITGDGGDELFAGYNYLLKLEESKLKEELRRLWDIMRFSSRRIGSELGIEVKTPYLDQGFMEFAKGIPAEFKVREHNGRRWGKWILRTCFRDDLGEEIAWRTKMPLEEGAGTSALADHFTGIGDDEFGEKAGRYAAADSVRIRDKEHLHYYELYRKFFAPPKEDDCEFRCPDCLGCVMPDARFCNTCGAFPIKPTHVR